MSKRKLRLGDLIVDSRDKDDHIAMLISITKEDYMYHVRDMWFIVHMSTGKVHVVRHNNRSIEYLIETDVIKIINR